MGERETRISAVTQAPASTMRPLFATKLAPGARCRQRTARSALGRSAPASRQLLRPLQRFLLPPRPLLQSRLLPPSKLLRQQAANLWETVGPQDGATKPLTKAGAPVRAARAQDRSASLAAASPCWRWWPILRQGKCAAAAGRGSFLIQFCCNSTGTFKYKAIIITRAQKSFESFARVHSRHRTTVMQCSHPAC